jgi:hypothetical protein
MTPGVELGIGTRCVYGRPPGRRLRRQAGGGAAAALDPEY